MEDTKNEGPKDLIKSPPKPFAELFEQGNRQLAKQHSTIDEARAEEELHQFKNIGEEKRKGRTWISKTILIFAIIWITLGFLILISSSIGWINVSDDVLLKLIGSNFWYVALITMVLFFYYPGSKSKRLSKLAKRGLKE